MNETRKKDELNEYRKMFPVTASDEFFQKPAVKVIIGAGILLGAIYVSRYFLNAAADMVRAYKNVKDAVKK